MDERQSGRPAWDIEVDFALGYPTYGLLAEHLYGRDAGGWWEDLGELLGGRPGWHCEFTAQGLLWSFGPLGSSLFNISPSTTMPGNDPAQEAFVWDRGYELFDYELDETVHLQDTVALRTWLEANESRHDGHLRSLGALVSGDGWADLGRFEWEARVTHDNSTFIGEVPKVPSEMVVADDLPGVILALQELMAHVFGAPVSAARHVRFKLVLDSKATAAAATQTRS